MTVRPLRHGRTIGLGIFALLLCSIAVLWSWNSVMAELLGLPRLAWRHALALCLLALSAGTAICLPAWILRRNDTE